MKSAVKIHNLTKRYDSKFQLNVDLEIPKGMIIGLIGENGAGKTTLMKSMLDIIHPEQGTISFEKGSEHVGVVLDQSFFPEILTPMDIHHIMKDIYSTWDADMYFRYMKDFDLPLHKAIKTMSKGMRKKLEIATAFSHHPSLLILDEPTSGLDPLMQMKFIELMKKAKQQGKTVFMSSHIFEEIENVCNRVVIIKEGQVVTIEDMEQLKHHRYKHYEIQFHSLLEMEKFMYQHPDAKRHQQTVSLLVKGSPDQLIKELSSYTIDDFNVQPQSLEEIFLQYYGE